MLSEELCSELGQRRCLPSANKGRKKPSCCIHTVAPTASTLGRPQLITRWAMGLLHASNQVVETGGKGLWTTR